MNDILSSLRWIALVSVRHIRSRQETDRNTASRLSVVGIAVGVAALVTVLSVMNGFQLGTIQAMLEVNSYHIRVDGLDPATDEDRIRDMRDLPGVRAVVPFAEMEGIVHGFFSTSRGVIFRALPGDVLERDERFASTLELVDGGYPFSDTGTVMLGEELRRALGVRLGDSIPVMTLGESARGGRLPREGNLTVVGTFRTGFYEYDVSWALIGVATASDFFGVGPSDSSIGIKLSDRFSDQRFVSTIRSELPRERVEVSTWRDYNRAMFSALRTEKLTMTILLGLIFVVVGANIYQSLRRSVHERADEIAILKGMGASPIEVQAVFVLEGLGIGVFGATLGLSVGLALSVSVNQLFTVAETTIGFVAGLIETVLGPVFGGESFRVFNPNLFYIREVPVDLVLVEVLGIVLFAVFASAAAAYFASVRASYIKPAEVLRDE